MPPTLRQVQCAACFSARRHSFTEDNDEIHDDVRIAVLTSVFHPLEARSSAAARCRAGRLLQTDRSNDLCLREALQECCSEPQLRVLETQRSVFLGLHGTFRPVRTVFGPPSTTISTTGTGSRRVRRADEDRSTSETNLTVPVGSRL